MRTDSLLTGFIGALAGLALGYTLAPGAAAEAAQPAHNPQLAALIEEVNALRLESRSPVQPAYPVESARTDVQPQTPAFDEEAMAAALAGLEQAIREANSLQRMMTASQQGAGASWRDESEGRPPETEAVRALRHGLNPEVLAADREHFGLSAAQLYQRYGTPDRISSTNERVRWGYYDPEMDDYITFTFIDRYVSWIHIHE